MFLVGLMVIGAVLPIPMLIFAKRIGLGFGLAIVLALIIVGFLALLFLAWIGGET
jgi:hypothetical protein